MARVLITGGAGFLGTVLCRQLLHAGHAIHVLDRFVWGAQPLTSACVGFSTLVRVFAGDLLDQALLQEALEGCDVVIHLAGVVGYPACDADPQEADRTNVEGTRRLATLVGPRPLLFASTGSTYGRVEGLATEDLPISPLTRYGRNKAQAEQAVRDAGGVCLRLATLFGPSYRMRWDLLPMDFAWRGVWTGEIRLYQGDARRTFLHVEDAAEAFVEALGSGMARGEVYNVGTPRGNRTKRQVAACAQAYTDCRVVDCHGEDPDQRDYTVDFQKVMAALPLYAAKGARSLNGTMPELVRWARVWREGRVSPC